MQKLAVMVIGDDKKQATATAEAIKRISPRVFLSPRPGMTAVSLMTTNTAELRHFLQTGEGGVSQEFNEAESRLVVAWGQNVGELVDQLDQSFQAAQKSGRIAASEGYWPQIYRMSDALIKHSQKVGLRSMMLMHDLKILCGETALEDRLCKAGIQVYKPNASTEGQLLDLMIEAELGLRYSNNPAATRRFRQATDSMLGRYTQILAMDRPSEELLAAIGDADSRLPILVDAHMLYLQMVRDWIMQRVADFISASVQ